MIPLILLLSGTALPCDAVSERRFDRLAQLPKAVVEAVGFRMAEKGQPFQATDVVSRPALPSARFVRAVQRRCTLTLDYEQGGIAHRWLSLRLVQDKTGWRREDAR